jgi:hypothetical protein
MSKNSYNELKQKEVKREKKEEKEEERVIEDIFTCFSKHT